MNAFLKHYQLFFTEFYVTLTIISTLEKSLFCVLTVFSVELISYACFAQICPIFEKTTGLCVYACIFHEKILIDRKLLHKLS